MKHLESMEALEAGFRGQGYIAETALLTPLFLMNRLGRQLVLEGHAGVGKTEVAKVLADLMDTDLIRLQCYEGLDVNTAVYEWNYQKQLLAIKAREASGDFSAESLEQHIFSRDFLLERPLLPSHHSKRPLLPSHHCNLFFRRCGRLACQNVRMIGGEFLQDVDCRIRARPRVVTIKFLSYTSCGDFRLRTYIVSLTNAG